MDVIVVTLEARPSTAALELYIYFHHESRSRLGGWMVDEVQEAAVLDSKHVSN